MTMDWVQGAGRSHVCQILLQIAMRAVIIASLPAWTSSVGMLSIPPPLFYTSSRLLYAVFSCLYQRKTCHFSHSYFTPIPNTHLFISDTDTSPPSLHCPRPSSSLVVPRSEELRTQKLKSHLVRTQSLNILPLKP